VIFSPAPRARILEGKASENRDAVVIVYNRVCVDAPRIPCPVNVHPPTRSTQNANRQSFTESAIMNQGGQDCAPAEPSQADPLDVHFYYQNLQTGQASGRALSLRQICRIVAHGRLSIISAGTLLYQLGGTAPTETDAQGWKSAISFPILAAALAKWYYEKPCTDSDASPSNGSASSFTVVGPVSCKDLATFCQSIEADSTGMSRVLSIRVYSDTAAPTWTAIRELPELQIALQALDDAPGFVRTEEHRGLALAQPNASGIVPSAPGEGNPSKSTTVHDELEAFLSSMAQSASGGKVTSRSVNSDDEDRNEEESYESDGGTRYVKDFRTRTWVHEALRVRALPKARSGKPAHSQSATHLDGKKRDGGASTVSAHSSNRKKKAKFSAKNARCWLYVTGLPSDTTVDEAIDYFSRAGILDLNPESQKPKIKLYTDPAGRCKGDASVCFARPESVGLAVTLFDEAPFRPQVSATDHVLHVEPAKFEAHSDKVDTAPQRIRASTAQRKVARLAALQATDWDDGEINGRLTGGRKGLRIIVLKRLFHPSQLPEDEDAFFAKLEQDLRVECERHGTVEKITVFSSHPEGVVVCKFAAPGAASEAVQAFNGKLWNENGAQKVEASFWDGVTDFTSRDTAKDQIDEQNRLEEFGAWLENHNELPDELKLKTED
jgi:HIV Tat-specific factor 1